MNSIFLPYLDPKINRKIIDKAIIVNFPVNCEVLLHLSVVQKFVSELYELNPRIISFLSFIFLSF